MSFDSIVCSICEGFSESEFYNDEEPIDSFIVATNRNLAGTGLLEKIRADEYSLSATKYPSTKPRNFTLPSNKKLVIYEVGFRVLTRYDDYDYEMLHRFQFVEVNGHFKFNGVVSGWTRSHSIYRKPKLKKNASKLKK
jgi:hypothetical protein